MSARLSLPTVSAIRVRPCDGGRSRPWRSRETPPFPSLRRSSDASVEARRNAVWALTRISGDAARSAVRAALRDADASVRHAATHGVSVWRDAAAFEALAEQVQTATPPLQRVAAEALGRLGDARAAPALLEAIAATEDEILIHSLTYALIEIADPAAVRPALRSSSARARRAGMIALDQMRPAALEPSVVLPLLTSSEPLLAETASWIAAQHPDWGGALAGYFRARLAKAAAGEEALEAQLVRFTADPAIQKLLAEAARSGNRAALGVMAKAAVQPAPAGWPEAIVAALAAGDAAALEAAVKAARALPRGEAPSAALDAALLRVGRREQVPDAVRVAALDAAIESLASIDALTFDFLLTRVAPHQPVAVRGGAARALSRAALSNPQLEALTAALPTAGPMELPALVEAYGRSADAAVGETWVAALESARGLANLRPDILETAAAGYPEPIRAKAAALLADRDHGGDAERLEALLAALPDGDIRRGQAVFNSAEAACSSCHAIGYLGGRIGPGLTKIGEIRSRRDLLEAVVFPSASFVRSFEPLVIETADDIYNGVPIEEDDAHITLALNANDQARIARASIEEIRPGTVSIMPSGLADQITRQELADLLAFLEGTRWGAR